MNNELTTALKNNFDSLISTLSALDQQQINQAPFKGSWTPAQVGDHLWKSYSAIDTLKGNVVETTRPADEKVKEIRDLFLNFELKFKSPDFIVPEETEIKKEDLINSLKSRTKELTNFAASHDLSPTCTDFEMPGSGQLTRLEWLNFLDVHTQRHIHQLKNMLPSIYN